MKILASTLLFLFIAFLAMPTILTLIEKSSNSAIFLDLNEEVQVKKEVVAICYIVDFESLGILQKFEETIKIPCKRLLKFDMILRNIFSPPPNFKDVTYLECLTI